MKITVSNIIKEYPKLKIKLPKELDKGEFEFIRENIDLYNEDKTIKKYIDTFIQKLNELVAKSEPEKKSPAKAKKSTIDKSKPATAKKEPEKKDESPRPPSRTKDAPFITHSDNIVLKGRNKTARSPAGTTRNPIKGTKRQLVKTPISDV